MIYVIDYIDMVIIDGSSYENCDKDCLDPILIIIDGPDRLNLFTFKIINIELG